MQYFLSRHCGSTHLYWGARLVPIQVTWSLISLHLGQRVAQFKVKVAVPIVI